MQDYYNLYFTLYDAVKSVNAALRVGGPATELSMLLTSNSQDIEDWIRRCVNAHCPPDFIAMHSYPHSAGLMMTPDFLRQMKDQSSAPITLSQDEDFLSHSLDKLYNLLRQMDLSDTEVVIDEWNSTMWQRDPCSDTCYKSAYIVKNALENSNRVSILAHGAISDFIEELKPHQETFHGGYGIFTYNGLKKSGFYAFRLLARLGEQQIDRGKGWMLLRRQQTIQLVLYHYCHYNRLHGYHMTAGKEQLDRYQVFQGNQHMKFSFLLEGMDRGEYICRTWLVGRSDGSAFDRWVSMGAPETLTMEELRYLASVSEPAYHFRKLTSSTTLSLSYTLDPHDVMLIELEPIRLN